MKKKSNEWLLHIVSVATVTLIVVILAVISIWLEKTHAEERTEITTRNYADSLDQSISGLLGKVDVALQAAVSRTQLQVLAGGHEDYAAFLTCCEAGRRLFIRIFRSAWPRNFLKDFSASRKPAAVQRSAISASL